MIVKRIDFQDFVFEFADGGYTMSYVVMKDVRVRVLRLETSDGHVGWGEIVRKPTVSADVVGPFEVSLLNGLVGVTLETVVNTVRELQLGDISHRGLAFGLETAYLDLIARRSGQPLYALLGGRVNQSVPDYLSFSCGDIDTFESSFKSLSAGRNVLQIKLGTNDLDTDHRQVEMTLSLMNDRQTLLADFNGALNSDSATSFLNEFADSRIIWEEPCDTADENIEVARRSGKPVMLDQSLQNLGVIARVVASGAAHSLVIKPALLGGITLGRSARDICISAGHRMRMDGPWSGDISTATLLHLTVGVPPRLLISGGDLRQKLVIPGSWSGIENCPDDRISPVPGIGHGVVPMSFDPA